MSWLREFRKGVVAGVRSVGEGVGLIVNTILLTFAYLAGVGCAAVLGKIAGKRFLDKRFDPSAKTYWEEHVVKTDSLEKYRRQF